jgi:hypothetical protein
LDLIFSPQQKPDGLALFTLSLRIVLAFLPESQVNVALLQNRTAKAEFIVSEKNVYHAANKLLQTTGEGQVEALAKKNTVKRYALNVSPTLLMNWQRGLMGSLGLYLLALQSDFKTSYSGQPTTLVLDGDSYEVWYGQGPRDFDLRLPQSATPSPLEIWAKEVHSAAEKMALQSNQ